MNAFGRICPVFLRTRYPIVVTCQKLLHQYFACFSDVYGFCSTGNSYLSVSEMVAVVRCSQQASEI
jgi:hypothetical protein